ncbi:MAG: hypothetical protein H6Q64_1580, partial [Firmicutes bacterium]|nr:hypothetical protein [Bacillota bacterium]
YIFMGWSKGKDTLAEYTVKGTTTLTMKTSDIILYAVWSKCKVTLVAAPKTIVGNGTSWTTLTATVTDVDGNPIEGVWVEFGASQYATAENFKDGTKAKTDANGKAVILYYSSNLETDAPTIFNPVEFRINATVNDIPKELHAQDWFDITFEPATLRGVLNEKITNEDGTESLAPIKDKVVTISGTRSGYSWSTTIKTDAEGKYSTFVPWGTRDYIVSYDRQIKTTGSNGEVIETNLTYTQNGTTNGATGTGGTFDSDKTIVGIVLEEDNGTSNKKLIDATSLSNYNIKIYNEKENKVGEGGLVTNGAFNIPINDPDFKNGSAYTVVVFYTDPTGKIKEPIIASVKKVTIDKDGVMNFSEALIDPYGTITEAGSSGKIAVNNATVTLYYSGGAHDGEQVKLPKVDKFAPANNDNPQTVNGYYAFMVFPHTDYYIKATAPGYYDYDSRTNEADPSRKIIKVVMDLVKYNFEMIPISGGGSGGGGGGGAVVTPTTNPIDLAVAIKSSSMSVIEGNSVTLTITYKNKSTYDANDVYVTGDVPASMSFVSAGNGGTHSGSTIKWALGTLKAGQTGTVTFVLKAKSMSKAEDFAIVTSTIGSNVKLDLINLEDDTSFVKLKLLSISGEHKHDRYIKGYPDNTVRPLGNITRAEIAAIFARIMDLEGNVTHTSAYSDVTTNFWAAEYIETANKAGVMKGYADGTFKPNQPITRAELATVIARYLGIVRETNLDQFLDLGNFSDTRGSWAQQTINELFRYAVVSGYSDGTFKPDQNISRAEAIKMINRMLYRGPLTNVEASFPDCTKEKWYFGDMEESIRTHKYTLGSDGYEIMTEYIEESLW